MWWIVIGIGMLPIARSTLNTTGEATARLTLLALQASAQFTNAADAAIWVLEERVHTAQRVIDLLGTLRKPVACEARLIGSSIHLHFRRMTDSTELRHWKEFQFDGFESMSELLRNRYGSIDENTLIDVRWSNESIIASLDEIRNWFLDYRIEFLLQEIMDPDQAAISSGATAIMRLGSVRDMVLDLEAR